MTAFLHSFLRQFLMGNSLLSTLASPKSLLLCKIQILAPRSISKHRCQQSFIQNTHFYSLNLTSMKQITYSGDLHTNNCFSGIYILLATSWEQGWFFWHFPTCWHFHLLIWWSVNNLISPLTVSRSRSLVTLTSPLAGSIVNGLPWLPSMIA